MDTEFTPFMSLGGGILIGLAATLLMLVLGRVTWPEWCPAPWSFWD